MSEFANEDDISMHTKIIKLGVLVVTNTFLYLATNRGKNKMRIRAIVFFKMTNDVQVIDSDKVLLYITANTVN